MTITVAQRLQSCFTVFMPTRTRTNESIYDKAERIAADPSNITTEFQHGTKIWLGIVTGDHGRYQAFAISPEHYEAAKAHLLTSGIKGGRLACRCRYGRARKLCSHMLVAEEMRLRGEDE
jgi:hypothetical protein